jgi:hypothetical protein
VNYRSFDRRSFLKAATSTAALLPLLRAVEARGQTVTPPKRFITFFVPNGVVEPDWRPTGTENSWTLGPALAPLEPYKSKMLMFGPSTPWEIGNARNTIGLSIKCDDPAHLPSGGHGSSKLLTGAIPFYEEGADGFFHDVAMGPSVDQVIAELVSPGSLFRSVELGVRSGNESVSWRAPKTPNPIEGNAVAAFNRLFGPLNPSPDAQKIRDRRKSVLDFSRAQFDALKPKVGVDQRRRLDQHLTSIREIEQRLVNTVAVGANCTRPSNITQLPDLGWDDYTSYPEQAAQMLDIVAAALACDLTRVITLQWAIPGANARHPFVNAPDWYHGYSHVQWWQADQPDARGQLTRIDAWYALQLKLLCDRLAAIPEGNGTVLDSTCILYVKEMSEAVFHTHQNLGMFLLGDLQGHFNTGRYLTFADKPHNDLLASVAHAYGSQSEKFGEPSVCNGPLPGLTT